MSPPLPHTHAYAQVASAGTPVYVGTCKLKLLKLLTDGLAEAGAPWFGFSAETADDEDTSARLKAAFPGFSPGSARATTVSELMKKSTPTIYDPMCSVGHGALLLASNLTIRDDVGLSYTCTRAYLYIQFNNETLSKRPKTRCMCSSRERPCSKPT